MPEPARSSAVVTSPAERCAAGARCSAADLNGWSSPQMLERYGASARGARARRSYDLVMDDTL